MTKKGKKPEPAPEALSFIELIRKIGNDTVASMRKDIAEGKLPVGKKKASKRKKA
jgi:hypothetical protein